MDRRRRASSWPRSCCSLPAGCGRRRADAARADRQADVELAAIRVRERRLAERLADERAAATLASASRGRAADGRRLALGRDRGREVLAVALRVHVPATDHGHHRARPSGRARARAPWNAMAAIAERAGRLDDEPASLGRQPDARRRSRPRTPSRSRRGSARRWANVRRPSACVRVPSAIVRDTSSAGQRTISPRSSDSRASAASSGSTPITRAPGPERLDGRRRRRWPARRRRPARARRRGRAASSASSSPTVPWPAMIRSSSNGGMIARPRSAAIASATCSALVAGRSDDHDLGAVGLDPLALDRRARRTA